MKIILFISIFATKGLVFISNDSLDGLLSIDAFESIKSDGSNKIENVTINDKVIVRT